MLFEQVYHPSFHERSVGGKNEMLKKENQTLPAGIVMPNLEKENSKTELATIRKFIRKFDSRVLAAKNEVSQNKATENENNQIYSKRWKQVVSKEAALNGPIFYKGIW